MIECIDDEYWERTFAKLTPALLARRLKALAKKVKLEPLQKSKRGPKKPPTPRTRYKNTPHVATQRILKETQAAS
jgi:hypothetical protein